MPEVVDALEIQRLQRTLFRPLEYQERRTERLTFCSERRFRWDIEQQLRIPWLEHEVQGNPCHAMVSLGIYPKKRLPDLVAYGPDGVRLAVLSREERCAALALALLDRPDLLAMMEQDELSVEDFEEGVRRLASILGDTSDGFDRGIAQLEKDLKDPKNLALNAIFGSSWDSFVERVSDLRELTHVLALIDCTAGRRVIIRHSFTEEIPELHPTLVVASLAASQHAGPDGTSTDKEGIDTGGKPLPVSEGWFWTRVFRITLKIPLPVRLALARLAQGLCLYPTTAARYASNADHCGSYYFLTEPLPGTQVEAAYWGEFVPREQCEQFDSDADGVVLAAYHSEGEVGDDGRCFVDTRADVSQFLTPLAVCILFAALAAVLSRRAWIPEGRTETILAASTAVPGALLAWLSQSKPSLRSFSARFLRRGIFATSVMSLTVGVVLIANLESLDAPEWLTKSVLCSAASAWALFMALLLVLTQRGMDRDGKVGLKGAHEATVRISEKRWPMSLALIDPIRKRLLVGNLLLLAGSAVVAVGWLGYLLAL
jgi:hypothetical protein